MVFCTHMKFERWWPLITVILSTIASSAINWLLPKPQEVVLSALLAIGVTLVVLLVIHLLLTLIRDLQSKGDILRDTLTAGAEDLSRRLDEVGAKLGRPAELVSQRYDESTGVFYRRLSELINNLDPSDSVTVMTHHARRGVEWATPSDEYAAARQEYMSLLLEKAASGMQYHRILCFDKQPKHHIPVDLIQSHVLDHCRLLLPLARQKPEAVSLRKAGASLMADMLLINDKIGVISLHTHVDAHRVFTAGVIVVYDPPNRDIISKMRSWCRIAEGSGAAITDDDLSVKPKGTA